MTQADEKKPKPDRENKKVARPEHKILVVEDQDMLRGTVTRYLKRQGYQVWSVNNGFEALLLIQYHKPDLIITDIRMPKLGGLTMAEGLRNREETKDIPLILITAHREESYFKRAQEVGATYFLLKPFTLAELHEKVVAVIKRLEEDKAKKNKNKAKKSNESQSSPAGSE